MELENEHAEHTPGDGPCNGEDDDLGAIMNACARSTPRGAMGSCKRSRTNRKTAPGSPDKGGLDCDTCVAPEFPRRPAYGRKQQ